MDGWPGLGGESGGSDGGGAAGGKPDPGHLAENGSVYSDVAISPDRQRSATGGTSTWRR